MVSPMFVMGFFPRWIHGIKKPQNKKEIQQALKSSKLTSMPVEGVVNVTPARTRQTTILRRVRETKKHTFSSSCCCLESSFHPKHRGRGLLEGKRSRAEFRSQPLILTWPHLLFSSSSMARSSLKLRLVPSGHTLVRVVESKKLQLSAGWVHERGRL